MAQTEFESVDDYIAAQPEAARGVLERVRTIIREAVPAAEEGISYKIPAYRLPSGPVIYFAGWKHHYSLYPVTTGVISAFAPELAVYEVEKGTIRFPLTEPVPSKLIAGIAKLRAEELDRASQSKASAPAQRAKSGPQQKKKGSSVDAREPKKAKK